MVGKPAVGWREWVALPELGITAIKAKIDTGARSSSLHASDVVEITRHDSRWLRFVVRPSQHDETGVTCEAPLVDYRDVRSSNGDSENRPVVATTILLGGSTFPIELTLTNRDEMGFRMLLGRAAIRRRFVVDPARSFLGGGTTLSPP